MTNFTLSPDQEEAIERIADFAADTCPDREITLSGRAGSGKSTVLKYAIDRLDAQRRLYNMVMNVETSKLNVVYTATTNQAAKLLSDMVGKETNTIHKLLGLTVLNDNKTGKTKTIKTKNTRVQKNSVVVVDEASMVDESMLKLIRELCIDCKVIYVGDHKQLPPVKHIHCPVFEQVQNQVKLTTIHRQAKGSAIKQLGEEYRKTLKTGKFPSIQNMGTEVELLDGDAFKQKVHHYFHTKDIKDVKILAFTNKKVNKYNAHIKSFFSSVNHHEVGDWVITNKPIFTNGHLFATDSILKITKVGPEVKEKGLDGRYMQLNHKVEVFQPNDYEEADRLLKFYQKDAKKNGYWGEYFEIKDYFADLRNIYSSTVHKAQGQTYKVVFLDLKDIGRCTKWQDVARMLYVGVTRATDKVYLYGDLPPRFYT